MILFQSIKILRWLDLSYKIIELASRKIVNLDYVVDSEILFFGEMHNVDWIINLEAEIIKKKSEKSELGFVGLEMFNYRMDDLLERWVRGEITWSQLVKEYSNSREGFPLDKYRVVLETARKIGARIIGVMPPREEANKVARIGIEAVDEIDDLPIDKSAFLVNYEGYKEIFMSMLPKEGPMTRLDPEKIFLAQALKDQVIAERTKYGYLRFGQGVVITGFAHIEFHGTASTRFKRFNIANCKVLTSRDESSEKALEELSKYWNKLEANYLAYKS